MNKHVYMYNQYDNIPARQQGTIMALTVAQPQHKEYTRDR